MFSTFLSGVKNRSYAGICEIISSQRVSSSCTDCRSYHGMDVTGGTIATGTNMADLSGFTLVLTGMEREPANFLSGATFDDPFAGLTTTPTVTVGT